MWEHDAMESPHHGDPAFAGTGPRWHALLCTAAVLLLFFTAARAADDDEDQTPPLPKEMAELARKYAGVIEWQGFFEATETGAAAWNRGGGLYSGSTQVEKKSHGHFRITRSTSAGWEPKQGAFRWGGNNLEMSGEATASEDHRFSEWGKSGDGREWRDQVSGTVPLFTSEFEISLKDGNASIRVGNPKEPLLRYERVGRSVDDRSRGDGQRHLTTTSLNKIENVFMFPPPLNPNYWNSAATYRMASSGPGVLVFSCEGKSRADTQPSTPEITHHSRVILYPVYDDLEVEVTIEGYAKWRPEGSIEKPTQPGNSLVARATLKSKTGAVKSLPGVKRFKFELLDTSREPGVCLNWPLGAKDQDFDLRLAAESGGQLSDADQKLKIADPPKDDQERPYAEARIDSYDFGGRATLEVVCELEDGREIIGLMKGEGGGQDLVRIPKMTGPDWIAESWRKEKKVENLADDDDNEKVAGQKDNGDGFTLYEEYRGWVENGKHIEGDPKKKDLFVRNEIGQDAKGGINLFERVSKLRVHSRLLPSEIIELPVDETQSVADAKGERIMNLNRRDAPQRVKQHAVRMMVGRHQGGATIGFASQEHFLHAFRPKSVRVVQLEPRDDPNAILTFGKSVSAYNLSERDAAFAYDRGVAHELLHVVGVDHHGEGEDFNIFYFQSASDPNNPTHHVRFTPAEAGEYEVFLKEAPFGRPKTAEDLKRAHTVTLIWEDTKQDVAESLAADYERELAAERSNRAANPPADDPGDRATRMPYYGKDANYWRETDLFDSVVKRNPKFNIEVTIGKLGEADSGNELCLMRYYFANAYPVSGREKTYYLVRPGADANRAGRELCKSPEGTIHNASSHSPQPRFGDSASGRGDCFSQICPNDDIPARRL